MTDPTQPEGALPEPDLEDVDYELWGQNAKADCWFEPKMRAMMAERDAAREEASSRRASYADMYVQLIAAEGECDALRRELEARKPLTIPALFAEMVRIQSAKSFDLYTLSFVEGARFAERHHGIPPAGTSAEDEA